MKAFSLYTGLGTSDIEVKRTLNHRKMEEQVVELFPALRLQSIKGFGGALTHATGYVLNRMDKAEADEVIEKYYSPSGAGYGYVRIPIDSCDFSPSTFNAAASVKDISEDRFDFSEDEEFIFPWLDRIYEAAGTDVPILLSPWSPPAYMKDNGSRLQGGRLLDDMRIHWAKYMARYALEYRNRGYNVWAVTIQNEPNAVQTWDSCLYTATEERDFLLEFLKPELHNAGLDDVGVFYWDHNKERLLSRAEGFLGTDTEELVSGIAFHGYCGDHFRSLELYRRQHPGHRMILSEFCMAYPDRYDHARQLAVYGHEFIGDIAFGADTILDWNLVLDSDGGPNHVGNFCMAPVMADDGFHPHYNMAFHVLSTLSRTIRPDDVVIEHSSFMQGLDLVAVIAPDKRIKVVIGAMDRTQEINIRIGENVFTCTVCAGTLTVLDLEEKDYE